MDRPFFVGVEKKLEQNRRPFSFHKKERLCRKKVMDRLFAGGSSFLVFPLKVVWMHIPENGIYPAQAAFSVSKKNFKKAVQRNLLKRRMREAYRLNKERWYQQMTTGQVAVFFIYIGKETVGFHFIQTAMQKGLQKILKEITNPNKSG